MSIQNPFKTLKQIKDLLLDLVDEQFAHPSPSQSDPRLVIEKIFKRGVKWFDYGELSLSKKRKYFSECQQALNSEAINNIRNYLIAQITQNSLKEHDPNQNYSNIRDAQMTINGIELFIQELESIPNPDDEKPTLEDQLKKFEAI